MDTDIYRAIFPNIRVRKDQNRMESKMYNNGSCVIVKPSGSKLTGRPASILIIDDPHPGREEAESTIKRDKVIQWYQADCLSRVTPGGRIFIIATRWHPQDLIGFVTSEAQNKEFDAMGVPEMKFKKISLPALAEEGEPDPIGREPGQALFPETRNERFLLAQKATMAGYEFESQYQQHPTTAGSNQADLDRIRFIDESDLENIELTGIASGWDIAASEGAKDDFTVGIVGARDKDGNFYLIDMCRRKLPWPKMKEVVYDKALYWRDRYNCYALGCEGVGGFKCVVDDIRATLRGLIKVNQKNPPKIGKDSKLLRAMPWLNLVEAGRVIIVRGFWNKDYLEELRVFPDGRHDDQVDATTILYESMFRRGGLFMAEL